MKRAIYFIVTIAVLYGSYPVYSHRAGFHDNRCFFGLMGCVNFADLQGPDSGGQELTTLALFGSGIVFDIHLWKNLSIRMEPLYIQKGGKIQEGTDPINQPGGQINSAFIELPFLIKYAFGNRFKPFGVAGFTAGYHLKSDITFHTLGQTFTGDLKKVTETFDFGWTFGGGIELVLNRLIFFLEARYTIGLTNLQKGGTVNMSSGAMDIDITFDKVENKYKNKGFQLLTGVGFPIG